MGVLRSLAAALAIGAGVVAGSVAMQQLADPYSRPRLAFQSFLETVKEGMR